MLPQYHQLDLHKPYIKIKFSLFALYTVLLPLISFIFCISWSLLYDFERSTSTHCEVHNYLPSISAAIGNYQPQRIVWQLSICIHFLPRLLIIKMYLEYYHEQIRKNRRPAAYLASLLNSIENFALLGLTLWTSADDYEIHKFCFITFIILSELYMLITYFIFKYGRKKLILETIDEISIKYKKNLFIINIISILLATYCFVRHNSHCEPGVYTIFAFFEYIVVLTNMGFHMTSYWDFYNRCLAFEWRYGFYFTHQ